jgi:hypothetical protein
MSRPEQPTSSPSSRAPAVPPLPPPAIKARAAGPTVSEQNVVLQRGSTGTFGVKFADLVTPEGPVVENVDVRIGIARDPLL